MDHHHTRRAAPWATRREVTSLVPLGLALLMGFVWLGGCGSGDLRESAFDDQNVAGGGSNTTSNGGGGGGGGSESNSISNNPNSNGNTMSDAGMGSDGGAGGEDVVDNVPTVDAGGALEVGTGQNFGGLRNMTGTWIQVQDLSTCVVVGNPTELRTRYLLKLDIRQEGTQLTETYDVCQVSNTPLLNLITTVPRAVLRASSGFQVASHLLGTDNNQGYVGGIQTHLWGLQMDNPTTDPFPTPIQMDSNGEPILDDNGNFIPDESHPNLIDSDADGNPGATLDLGGGACKVYMIQRALTSAVGNVQPDGTISGIPYSRTQQFIMTADNPICGQSFETFSNNAFSSMKMWRADAFGFNIDADGNGSISCEELIAVEDQIVTWTEPDNDRCTR